MVGGKVGAALVCNQLRMKVGREIFQALFVMDCLDDGSPLLAVQPAVQQAGFFRTVLFVTET